jgi:N-acetylneuraminic acid mutarotase
MIASRRASVVLIMVTLMLIVAACTSTSVRQDQGAGPGARVHHVMAYDVESDRIILFGGCVGDDKCLNDTWAYDLETNTWQDMSPAQSPPIGQGLMAYDVQSDRMVLFLALVEDYKPGGETWAYDYNANTWMDMEPAEAPFGLDRADIAYDTESDRIILFGGMDPIVWKTGAETLFDDTWAYDLDSNTWTRMEPEVRPSGRSQHTMIYDDSSDRVILFGGYAGISVYPGLNDTWSYDYNTDTWEELETGEAPSARYAGDMVYDAGSDRAIMFGGINEFTGKEFDETWAFYPDTHTWAELNPDPHPSKSDEHVMIYSTKADRVILSDGEGEIWIHDPATDTWAKVTSSL